jgi:plasmid stability protein
MATLLAWELNDELVRLVKLRAKNHSRSAEAELRAILGAALRLAGERFLVRARRLQDVTRGRLHRDLRP